MLAELSDAAIETIKQAARKLKGCRRRQFQAEVAQRYCDGSPRLAERTFGWGRAAVNTGLNELRTGIRCVVEFSDRHQLTLELAYYPPYHSKYDPIERCWGILENHWNGTLLASIDNALDWARTMTWRGVRPLVHLLEGVYETGVRIGKSAFQPIATRLKRSTTLPKWSVVIQPNTR
jgi:Rhodopirellula transposase DDE domain